MQDKPLEKRSQSPLYQQIMDRLRNDVLAGVYPAGARVPGEQALCEAYGVSRITVRKAMADLVREGLLVRRRGKGTFVAGERIRRDLAHITSFSDVCRARGQKAGTKPVSMGMTPATAEDAEKLGVEVGSPVLEICRLRLCDDEPVMLEINRFPESYGFLTEADTQGSLYEALLAHGVKPTTAAHEISLGYAAPAVAKRLGCEPGTALLLLNETVLDQHGEPLHTSRQWIRGDKYTFRI